MGNMSPDDAASFEKELASDPALKAESDFQSNIINGIREHRKMTLKSRLDAIDISPGWMEFAQQSALVKSFGGIAIASIIGSGVYFIAQETKNQEEADLVTSIEFEVPQAESPEFEWIIPQPAGSDKVEVIDEQPVTKAALIRTREEVIEPNTIARAEETTKENFTPDFTAPQAGEVSEENELGSTELDEVSTVAKATTNEEPIEVETRNSRNSKIRYKYYDGKLFLNGDFNNEPYEILEINNAKGRRIYLLHQKKYYEVKITDRLSELPEVTNVKLIQELRLIKENK